MQKNDDVHQQVIDSAKNGNLEYLKSQPTHILREAKCDVGCSILHWAAGTNQIPIVEFLLRKGGHPQCGDRTDEGDNGDDKALSNEGSSQKSVFENVDIQSESKLAKGRTPLFYAVRNGHLEMTKILIEKYHANPFTKAKQGVTPFQLAIWQNRLDVCQYLVNECGVVPSEDVNDFGCGAIHWLGIVPFHRANFESNNNPNADEKDSLIGEGLDLMPMARWILSQPNIDINAKQNQGHTVLHKAAWGGHLALIRYLHERFDMNDDCVDCAGNYAADICDMMKSKRHKAVALYLRRQCSLERLQSLKLLGLEGRGKTDNLNHDEIRRAYLEKAKQFHPDAKSRSLGGNSGDDQNIDFDQIREAYELLTSKGGVSSKQKNPAHSINLLLEMQCKTPQIVVEEESANEHIGSIDNDDLFKARLLAVLLDFGEKGMNLGNIPKRWDQIWPSSPLDSYFNGKKRKSGDLLKLIKKRAGDVVRITQMRHTDKQSGRKGAIMVFPRNLSRADVLKYASDNNPTK